MKKYRYKVHTLMTSVPLGEEWPKPRSFATREEAEEYAFLQRLTGYKIEISGVEMVPLDTEERRKAILKAIVSRI